MAERVPRKRGSSERFSSAGRPFLLPPAFDLRPVMPTDTIPESVDLDTPVWGAAAIARVINRSERATFHALEKRLLPAEKVGKIWVSTPRKLLSRILGQATA